MKRSPKYRLNRRRFLVDTLAAGAGLISTVVVGCGGNKANKANTQVGGQSATRASGTVVATATAGAATPAQPAFTSPTPAAASALKLTKDIEFGFIASFTGPLAPIYAPFVNGAKLAISEINDQGGLGGVKLVLNQADDKSNPANVPAAALGLVDKQVPFCIGPIGSNAISASPALNQGHIIQCGYSDNPDLANPQKFPYSFRFVWSAQQSSKLIIDYFMNRQGIDKIAILAENTVYGQTDAPTTQQYMQQKGLKPTLFEYFAPGTSNFVPLLQRVRDAGSKAIVWWTQGGPEGITIVRNMNDIGLDIPIAGIGIIAGALKGVVPDTLLDKVWGVTWKRLSYNDKEQVPEKVQQFRDKLAKVNGLGDYGSGGTAPFYDFVYYMKAAIEATKSVDTKAIVEYMESHGYDGVIANYDAISKSDHSTVRDDSITLVTASSYDPNNKVFQRRAPGL